MYNKLPLFLIQIEFFHYLMKTLTLRAGIDLPDFSFELKTLKLLINSLWVSLLGPIFLGITVFLLRQRKLTFYAINTPKQISYYKINHNKNILSKEISFYN